MPEIRVTVGEGSRLMSEVRGEYMSEIRATAGEERRVHVRGKTLNLEGRPCLR